MLTLEEHEQDQLAEARPRRSSAVLSVGQALAGTIFHLSVSGAEQAPPPRWDSLYSFQAFRNRHTADERVAALLLRANPRPSPVRVGGGEERVSASCIFAMLLWQRQQLTGMERALRGGTKIYVPTNVPRILPNRKGGGWTVREDELGLGRR